GRGAAEAAAERAGEIRQDVGVEVGGDDGVETLRLERHPDRHRIDQHLVPGYVGIFLCDFGRDLVPHNHAVALCVGFGDHGQEFAWARLRQLERVTHDALDTDAGEDRHFGADLLGQTPVDTAAAAGIFAFGIFAHDHPVEIADADIAQWRSDTGQDL